MVFTGDATIALLLAPSSYVRQAMRLVHSLVLAVCYACYERNAHAA